VIERLCGRAVEIDPCYAEAWALLASAQYSLHYRHGLAGDDGEAALDRALALKPDLAEARSMRAWRLARVGRRQEAEAELDVALQLDPESFEVNIYAAFMSYNEGRLEEAAPYFEKVAALMETDLVATHFLITCYANLGDGESTQRIARIALARAEKAVARDRSNSFAMGVAVHALSALGENDRAKDWMDRALLIDPDNTPIRYEFACTLATSLNDPEAALDMLESALERNPFDLVRRASTDPDFAGLRDDPRFQAMVSAAEARLAASNPVGRAGASQSA
jgi:adenylate cyclase